MRKPAVKSPPATGSGMVRFLSSLMRRTSDIPMNKVMIAMVTEIAGLKTTAGISLGLAVA